MRVVDTEPGRALGFASFFPVSVPPLALEESSRLGVGRAADTNTLLAGRPFEADPSPPTLVCCEPSACDVPAVGDPGVGVRRGEGEDCEFLATPASGSRLLSSASSARSFWVVTVRLLTCCCSGFSWEVSAATAAAAVRL